MKERINSRDEALAEARRLMKVSAWEALAAALATLLLAGYVYSQIVPLLEAVGMTGLSMLRHACHIAVGVTLPFAVWSGLCLTGRPLVDEAGRKTDRTGR